MTILTHAFLVVDARNIGNNNVEQSTLEYINAHKNGFTIANSKCTKEVNLFLIKSFLTNVCETAQSE
ncbi:MAG: hypothetical protein AAF847_10010 [Bacteroidota bacterium]